MARPATSPSRPRDEGSALTLALVVMLLVSLVTLSLVDYIYAVQRQAAISHDQLARMEAVKGGLRVALVNPVRLFHACAPATATTGQLLAGPALAVPVRSHCFVLEVERRGGPAYSRYALTTTRVGSTVPTGSFVLGTPYPRAGANPPQAWRNDATSTATKDKIWLPQLPQRVEEVRRPEGYAMPGGQCRVYFPGTYRSPVILTADMPTYFASGVYYFEDQVRVTAGATLVGGAGSEVGCTDDLQAVRYAIGAPSVHRVNGGGVAFVFGAIGRLVVDDTASADSPPLGQTTRLVLNQRYVSTQRLANDSTGGVSVMAVNGVMSGTTYADLSTTDLFVPKSTIVGAPTVSPPRIGYVPSRLTADTLAPTVNLRVVTNRPLQISIPGYVSIPQGELEIWLAAGIQVANKDISIGGGVLARSISLTLRTLTELELGINSPVVLRKVRIDTVSTAGRPVLRSSATVQLRENGMWGINSWEVRRAD